MAKKKVDLSKILAKTNKNRISIPKSKVVDTHEEALDKMHEPDPAAIKATADSDSAPKKKAAAKTKKASAPKASKTTKKVAKPTPQAKTKVVAETAAIPVVTTTKKEIPVKAKTVRLSMDIDKGLHMDFKIHSIKKGYTMKELIIELMGQELKSKK